jgi:hypothetical protein
MQEHVDWLQNDRMTLPMMMGVQLTAFTSTRLLSARSAAMSCGGATWLPASGPGAPLNFRAVIDDPSRFHRSRDAAS